MDNFSSAFSLCEWSGVCARLEVPSWSSFASRCEIWWQTGHFPSPQLCFLTLQCQAAPLPSLPASSARDVGLTPRFQQESPKITALFLHTQTRLFPHKHGIISRSLFGWINSIMSRFHSSAGDEMQQSVLSSSLRGVGFPTAEKKHHGAFLKCAPVRVVIHIYPPPCTPPTRVFIKKKIPPQVWDPTTDPGGLQIQARELLLLWITPWKGFLETPASTLSEKQGHCFKEQQPLMVGLGVLRWCSSRGLCGKVVPHGGVTAGRWFWWLFGNYQLLH